MYEIHTQMQKFFCDAIFNKIKMLMKWCITRGS